MKNHEFAPGDAIGNAGSEQDNQSTENSGWNDVAALSEQYDPEAARVAVEAERANIQQPETAETETERPVRPIPKETPRDPLSAAQRQAISAQARVSTIQNQLNLVNFQSNALEAQLAEFRQNNGFLKRRFGKSAGEFRTLQQNLKLLQAQRAELESQLSASGMPQDKLASSA